MKNYLFLLILFCLHVSANSQNYTIKSVPNPKNADPNFWVSDPDNYLTTTAKQILETKLNEIESSTTAEVTLVIITNIGTKQTPHDFGVDLFNYWKIGKTSTNNGLLILMVMGQRRVEFITGYGMEAELPDVRCYQIQQEYMVPQFKQGKYAAGLIAGVDAIGREFMGSDWQDDSDLSRHKVSSEMDSIKKHLEHQLKTTTLDNYTWGLDSIVSDTVLQIIQSRARAMDENHALKVYSLSANIHKPFNPNWVLAVLLQEWGLAQDQEISQPDYIVIYYDQKSKHIALDYNTPHFLSQFNKRTIDYFKLQLKNKIKEGSVDSLYTYALNLIEENLNTSKLLKDANLHHKKIQTEREAKRNAWLKELELERAAANRKFYWNILTYYLIVLSLFLIILGTCYGIAEYAVKNPYQKYHILTFFVFIIWAILFPIPYIWLRLWVRQKRKAYRNAPRNSKKNGLPMRMLTEEEEDRYLKAGQITEENINSIHYDVWITADESDLLILPYRTLFSKYNSCPKCRWRTYYLVYNKTIQVATTSSAGVGEKKYSCEHCNHVHIYSYVIPKKTESSSSSGGGSFGGGSSGGGGSGSSW